MANPTPLRRLAFAGWSGPGLAGRSAGLVQVDGQLVGLQPDRDVIHRDPDDVGDPVALSVEQRGQHRLGQHVTAGVVDELERDDLRLAGRASASRWSCPTRRRPSGRRPVGCSAGRCRRTPTDARRSVWGCVTAGRRGPGPCVSMTPGRNPSSTTSAVSASRSICCLASSLRRSAITDFLPRLLGRNKVASGGRPGRTAVMCRAASPTGASILMTSAPRSASTCPASGPATFWVKSSTRNPSSGLAGLAVWHGSTFAASSIALCKHRGAVVVRAKGRVGVGAHRQDR